MLAESCPNPRINDKKLFIKKKTSVMFRSGTGVCRDVCAIHNWTYIQLDVLLMTGDFYVSFFR